MTKEIQVRKWVFSDPKKNSNKFWNVHQYDDGTWKAEYGRIGKSGTFASKKYNHELASKIKEKEAKGYKEIVQANSGDKHAVSTPVGSVSVSEVKRAFEISKKIISVNYNSDKAFELYPQYMQILPVNIGMRSDPYNIYRQIKLRHDMLKNIIEMAENSVSNDLFRDLIYEFFSEIKE